MAATRLQGLETAELVRRRLTGSQRDVAGRAFQGLLLVSLFLALAVLLILLSNIANTGAPLLRERGASFLTDNISSLPERAGIAQGIRGSVTIVAFVVLLAF